jgi:hypothetical protein
MNRGLLAGITADAWKRYDPYIKNVQFAGGTAATDPTTLGTDAIQLGRYQQTRFGFVICQMFIQFGAGAALGTGDAMNFRLPVRAARWSESSILPTGADIPIGQGQLWQGSAADPAYQKTVTPTLADPNVTLFNGEEDMYCHLFHSGNVAQGTATIAASGTSVAVTHGLNDKCQAADITLVPSGTPSGSNWQSAYVDTFTTTGFTIRTRSSVGTGGQSFAWRIDARPWTDAGGNGSVPQLVAPDRPWVWGAGHSIGMEIFYEAQA